MEQGNDGRHHQPMLKDVQTDAGTCSADRMGRILRIPAVVDRVGLSRSTVYNRMRSGSFPRAVNLGGRAVGFVEQEIDNWLSAAAARRNIQQGA